jgi:hypothetical protein
VIDLVCLVADKSIEAAIDGVLRRPEALGVRPISFETVVHPRRDPGCYHEAEELLNGYTVRAGHALVVLDRDWQGAPAGTAPELEQRLEDSLRQVSLQDWARVVVIDPELEVWVFSDSPHVAAELGWPTTMADLRAALAQAGLWEEGRQKPRDPKAAVDWALRRARRPRSSSTFRALASKVGFRRCQDRSFLRLVELLRRWFGPGSESS